MSWLVCIIFCSFFFLNWTWVPSLILVINALTGHLWGSIESKFYSLKLILTRIILLIITNNFIGLTPFTYGLTSSLWFNRSLALSCWGCFLLSGWVFSFKASAAHLVPAGSPVVLIPFLVIIETIRVTIRPLTLRVRLIANIRAGHIVLALISNVMSSCLGYGILGLLTILIVSYYLFEFFVCFIQAYIFTLLLSLYSIEHPTI